MINKKQLNNDKNNIYEFLNYINTENVNIFSNEPHENHIIINNFSFKDWKLLKKNKHSVFFYNIEQINKNTYSQIKKLQKMMDCLVIQFSSKININMIKKFLKLSNKNLYGYINYDSKERKIIVLSGRIYDSFLKKVKLKKVLAIIHTYNEADCIEITIKHLLKQGIDVKIFDNWSTDETWNILTKLANEYPNRIFIDKYPTKQPKENNYDWYGCLKNVEKVSKEMDYDWFIHYDSDEIRIAPYPQMTLQEYISHVDALGYNAISNTVIDFRLVSNTKKENIFNKNTYFEFGRRPGHFVQIKTFKKQNEVDIATGGGHNCNFVGQKVFPLKIILKHYPMRSIKQAKQKIFIDRLPRFEKERKLFGWHTQYDSIVNEKDFIYNSKYLYKYDQDTTKKYFIELLTGVGINKE